MRISGTTRNAFLEIYIIYENNSPVEHKSLYIKELLIQM
ncbi:hypothetical protein NT04LM_1786 [Listeria monocytogenes FSL F2-208]|nr:hypothetical protein NT04LM_1786 [Listeria monocytogenes FSL F2-208]